jgi:Ni/Co efflux regulator RcnB
MCGWCRRSGRTRQRKRAGRGVAFTLHGASCRGARRDEGVRVRRVRGARTTPRQRVAQAGRELLPHVRREGALRCACRGSDACTYRRASAKSLCCGRSSRLPEPLAETRARACAACATTEVAAQRHIDAIHELRHASSVRQRDANRFRKRQIAPPTFTRRIVPSGLSVGLAPKHRNHCTREHRDATPRGDEVIDIERRCQVLRSTMRRWSLRSPPGREALYACRNPRGDLPRMRSAPRSWRVRCARCHTGRRENAPSYMP